jgi:glycolate oxidase FAD binding subunit
MPVFDELGAACGDGMVREAAAGDAVDGVQPAYVAMPSDPATVAEVLAVAADHGLRVVARGAGSKLDWGNPPAAVDLIVDVSALDAVLEHAAGDLIVRVQPGVRLDALQKALASSGQRLAIDEVVPGSTIGGVIATALSGPSRLLHGAVRDLLIGVTVVRADGVVAHSGGKVVKNVAGYDLCKLYTGSYGTLGVITEAIFRLHPVPAASAYVSVVLPDDDEARRKIAAAIGSQVLPTAVEIDSTSGSPLTMCVLIEGFGPGVAARAARLSALIEGDISSDAPAWWGSLPAGATTIRMSVQPSGVVQIARAVADSPLEVDMRGSAGSGVLYAGIDEDLEPVAIAVLLGQLRKLCIAEGGSAVLVKAPVDVKSLVDVWGDIPAIDLMRRVKDSFDPQHRLAPGRFVGGI